VPGVPGADRAWWGQASARPAHGRRLSFAAREADDRQVPGNLEGDLIIGKDNRGAIDTLVDRASGNASSSVSPRISPGALTA